MADGLPLPQRGYAVAVTGLGTLMAMMDVTIANVALPTIARELGTTASASIWIVNAYQLSTAILIVPLASLGDIVGHARVFRFGLVLFVLASLACASSRTLGALVAARALQGVGAAANTATVGALNRHAYPSAMLGRAAGQGALMVALGAAAGPVVGGAILAVAPWPWLFAINAPLGLGALLLSLRFLPRVQGNARAFDWAGAGLSMLSFGLSIAAIDAVGHRARPALAAAAAAGTVVVGIAFVRRERRAARPLFGLDLFAQPVFALSIASSVTAFIAQTIAYVALPFLFQLFLGRTPLGTGLLMLPWLAAAAVAAPVAGRLSDRFSAGRLGAAAMVLFAAGLLSLALLPVPASTLDVLWRMTVCGVAWGFFQSPNNRTILASTPRERTGAAQGMLATARLTGQTVGAALVALLFGVAGAQLSAGLIALGQIRLAVATAAGFAVAAAVASALRRSALT